MIYKNWIEMKKNIQVDDRYIVTYRCNWHRGRGSWSKPNKQYSGPVDFIGEDFIQFPSQRINYRAIITIEKEGIKVD